MASYLASLPATQQHTFGLKRTESLAEAFRAFATAIEQRVRQRGHIIRVLAPAIIMAFVGVVLAFSVIALFLPLVSMISGLA